ncbi:MAG: hypothetical protein LUC91_02605 [Prevotella sp.]|nr:hypothetical protein [Prevotella sp.]
MDIIKNNPYRLLGVYANSSKKELLANLRKIKAFLEVGKPVSFPLDLTTFLDGIDRTSNSVAAASGQLALPVNSMRYAQFWFVNSTSIDGIAMNHLIAGNMDSAVSFWEKKDNASSLQNRIVCALISQDYAKAIACAEKLYSAFKANFVGLIMGNGGNQVAFTKIEYDFLDDLVDEVGAGTISDFITIDGWKQYVSKKEVESLLHSLNLALSVAVDTRGKGSTARLAAGRKLMKETKTPLKKLKFILSSGDLQYQMITDKVGLEVLQCSIDYFNDTDDPDGQTNAMDLLEYATSIVVGKMAKARCNENSEVLRRVGKEFIVRKEVERIISRLERLKKDTEEGCRSVLKSANVISDPWSSQSEVKPDPPVNPFLQAISSWREDPSVTFIREFVNDCKPDLASIKEKVGYSSPFYIDISSKVATASINSLVKIINYIIEYPVKGGWSLEGTVLIYNILDACSIMDDISDLDMNETTKSYFKSNKDSLNTIRKKLEPKPPGGCYIATMVYGDYNHPKVMVLREFRDKYLAKRNWGRRFIRFYYKHSPNWVEKLEGRNTVNSMIRRALDQFVNYLKGPGREKFIENN